MTSTARPVGVLLVNLGTPDAPETEPVRRYLREFLGDPLVLTMPAVARWLLLNLIILRTRPRRTAAAYQKIWTSEGSPLLVHSRELAAGVSKALGDDFHIELAMRYGKPSLAEALGRMQQRGIERLIVVPLFPLFATANHTSIEQRIVEILSEKQFHPERVTLPTFYDDPGWISAVSKATQRTLEETQPDHTLFSFHGLPENQVKATDTEGLVCLQSEGCCDQIVEANRNCYRAQSFAHARAVAARLDLAPGSWSVAFQSRLAGTPWIQPFTDHVLPELAERGVRKLVVVCPAFVADNLETLEEIGIRGRDQWAQVGGEVLGLAPCPNAEPSWVSSLSESIRAAVTPETSASATETPSR